MDNDIHISGDVQPARRRTFSSSGRPVGNNWFGQYELDTGQPKELPHDDDLMNVVSDLKSQLRLKNEELSAKSDHNEELQNELEERSKSLKESQTTIQALEARLRHFETETEIQRKVARPGPQLKTWEHLSNKQKSRETKPVLDTLTATAVKRGIDPTQMAGYLVHRYNVIV